MGLNNVLTFVAYMTHTFLWIQKLKSFLSLPTIRPWFLGVCTCWSTRWLWCHSEAPCKTGLWQSSLIVSQHVEGGDPALLLSIDETHLESWVQFWAPPGQKRCLQTGMSPVKYHEDNEGLGVTDVSVEAGRDGTFQPGEVSGGSYQCA